MKLSQEDEALLVEEHMLRAFAARQDPVAFVEYVMRTNKGMHLRCPPHHRVALNFIEDHRKSVCVWPVNAGKTFVTSAVIKRMLGRDRTTRGAIVSATEGQAQKTLRVVSDYIQNSPELRLVYPDLKPSRRSGDAWTQSKLIIDRPPGIADPTIQAIGIDSRQVLGSRLQWVVADDILNLENVNTPDARKKVVDTFDTIIQTRLDVGPETKVIVCNTAFYPDDLVGVLEEKKGWATLKMDILGGIRVQDDRVRKLHAEMLGEKFVPWDHPELRDAGTLEEVYRLRSHDPDPRNEVPLWPERFFYEWSERLGRSPQTMEECLLEHALWLEEKRNDILPHIFNKVYMSIARDDGTAMCKKEWVEKCKKAGADMGHHGFVHQLSPHELAQKQIFTGMDLAFSQDSRANESCLFTFEQLPSGHRKILNIEAGRWDVATLGQRLVDTQRRYNSIVRVEGNTAQKLVKTIAHMLDASVPVKSVDTSRENKHHVQYGVHSVFLDMFNGAWVIPCSREGRVPPEAQKWIDECLNYQPGEHSGDRLMASWIAREQAREWGVLKNHVPTGGNNGAGFGQNLLAR